MTKKAFKYSLCLIFLSTCLALTPVGADFNAANQAKAEDWWNKVNEGGLKEVGQAYGNEEPRNVRVVVIDIINIVLGFLGIIFLILIIYAGFKWMTAGGNEENVTAAKKLLTNSVIGLIIVLSAYILANFVINNILKATTGAVYD